MHAAARTEPDEQTVTAYVALAASPHARNVAKIIHNGPAEALAQLPASDARKSRDSAARLIEAARAQGVRAIVPGHHEWPQQIENLNEGSAAPEAPLCLWARGPLDLSAALDRSIMVTGARAATHYGTTVTTNLCYQLADRWTIANLGGYGIDAAALNAAAVAPERVPPLVMLPSGIDRMYPAQHANMFDAIASTGVLVSAYPPGTEPHKHNFIHTRVYLAALTTATLIVEAIPQSTTVAAARRAAAIGRCVMAVPGPVGSAQSVGSHELIQSGVAGLVTDARDITVRLTSSVG